MPALTHPANPSPAPRLAAPGRPLMLIGMALLLGACASTGGPRPPLAATDGDGEAAVALSTDAQRAVLAASPRVPASIERRGASTAADAGAGDPANAGAEAVRAWPVGPAPRPMEGPSASRGGAYYLDDGPGQNDAARLAELARLPDPEPRDEPLHTRANRPYQALGNAFVPMTQREAFRQRGTASWYGSRYHGRSTSIGEPYDMYGMTAAHPTLPLPSYVRVTHLGNGRSVVVRVNDRGPFLRDRVIDLSYLAAHKLGYVEAGHAPVEVEVLLPDAPGAGPAVASAGAKARTLAGVSTAASGTAVAIAPAGAPAAGAAAAANPPRAESVGAAGALVAVRATRPDEAKQVEAASATGHFLQLGAFRRRDGAEQQAGQMRLAPELDGMLSVIEDGGLYRVKAGPFGDRRQAQAVASAVRERTGLRPLLVEQR